MPRTRNSDIRYQVIDSCLRSGGYSIQKIMDKVNDRLDFEGYEKVTALNTIRNDIKYLGANYPDIIIESHRNGRFITYSYQDKNSSIYKLQLTDEELAQLSQCVAVLSHFEGLPQMDWLESFIERFKLSINIEPDGKRVVGFDECPYLRGRELFSTLLSAICEKQVLKIGYKSFANDTIKSLTISPYYIKEFNKRWYLLGGANGYDTPSTLAFDRIESITPMPELKYCENTQFDFNDEYFADIVGITKYSNCEIEKVVLRVANASYPYIKTKPIHGSQKVISKDDEFTMIQLELIPNYELEQIILYYAEAITVISPITLKNKILKHLKLLSENYQLVQNE